MSLLDKIFWSVGLLVLVNIVGLSVWVGLCSLVDWLKSRAAAQEPR